MTGISDSLTQIDWEMFDGTAGYVFKKSFKTRNQATFCRDFHIKKLSWHPCQNSTNDYAN